MSDSLSEPPTGRLPEQGADPSLTVIAPASLAGARIAVRQGEKVLLGREGALAMESIGLSRRHAWLEYDGRTFVITDAESTNGTMVNGRRIDGPTTLADVDTVGLGELRAVVAISRDDPLAAIPQPRQPAQRLSEVPSSETTRELCVAVQTDRKFREYVIDEIVEEPYRALCPSHGVDLVTVATHAVAAQRRSMLRDSALALLLVLLLSAVAAKAAGAVVLVLFVAWLVVVATRFFEGYFVLARHLSQAGGRTDPPRVTVTPTLRRRLEAISSAQGGNVTVFSDYLPFVGSGFIFDHWSFAIDIQRGAVDKDGNVLTPRSFSAGDLYDALKLNLATTGIPGLRVEERLLVHGRDLNNLRDLLPRKFGRPVPRASEAVLRQARATTAGSARTYLSIQTSGWQGHLVATIFFRAVRLPSALYLESTSTALLPLSDEFQDALRRPRDAAGVILESVAAGSIRTLPSLVLSPFRVARGVFRPMRSRQRRRDQRHRIEDGTFDYGSVTSVREQAAGTSFTRYYLEFDRDMYDKVLQERLLQHVMDFLTAHDVDTSAFRQQMVTINTQNTYNTQSIQNMSGGNVVGGTSKVKGGLTSSVVGVGQNRGGD